MNPNTKKLVSSNQNWRVQSRYLWMLYCAFGRRQDLARLVDYCKRKRISGPGSHYARLLADEEIRLSICRRNSPRLVAVARFLYRLNKLIFPTPKNYSSGTAKAYRTQNLTKSKSWLSFIPTTTK